MLVDDLVTTGSSLTEAARVLGRAGVPVLGAATVAATERHGDDHRHRGRRSAPMDAYQPLARQELGEKTVRILAVP